MARTITEGQIIMTNTKSMTDAGFDINEMRDSELTDYLKHLSQEEMAQVCIADTSDNTGDCLALRIESLLLNRIGDLIGYELSQYEGRDSQETRVLIALVENMGIPETLSALSALKDIVEREFVPPPVPLNDRDLSDYVEGQRLSLRFGTEIGDFIVIAPDKEKVLATFRRDETGLFHLQTEDKNL